MGGTAAHLKKYRFQPGNKLGGRPIGSRTKLSETMLALLQADAAEHGAEVIARVRKEDPSTWLRCMVSLLPKQLQVERHALADLSDQELELLEQHLASTRAKLVREIERHQANGAVIAGDAPALATEPEQIGAVATEASPSEPDK